VASLIELVLPVIVLGKVRSGEHDEGVQAGHGAAGHRGAGRGPELEQLRRWSRRSGGRQLRLLHLLLDSVGVNCIDQKGPGDLPGLPAVLSGQEPLQEEDLGSEEGCQGSLRSRVTLRGW